MGLQSPGLFKKFVIISYRNYSLLTLMLIVQCSSKSVFEEGCARVCRHYCALLRILSSNIVVTVPSSAVRQSVEVSTCHLVTVVTAGLVIKSPSIRYFPRLVY